MKYTISERTITVETTQPGETLTRETVQALTERKTEAWQTVERLALAAPEVLAAEAQWDLASMVPANILPAE